MKVLLDTHSFLWSAFSPEKLSQKARDAIERGENDVFVSVITFWEISLKFALGKINLSGITPEQLPDTALE